MMESQPDSRPSRSRFRGNPFKGPQGQRFVPFVLEISDAAAQIVIPHEPEKGDDGALDSPLDLQRKYQPLKD